MSFALTQKLRVVFIKVVLCGEDTTEKNVLKWVEAKVIKKIITLSTMHKFIVIMPL